jgi:UDP-N-acetylglucosamine 2-epimerase
MSKIAFVLGPPCVTIFKSTPWPETLRKAANRCVEADSHAIVAALSQASMLAPDNEQIYPLFGNGHASERVCRTLLDQATR